MTFGFSVGSRNFHKLFPSLGKFSCCMGKIESIEWQDLVPRLRIGDCFEIHFLRLGLCDLLLSSHQTFLLVVELRQCVSCTEPLQSLVRKQTSQFGLLGSEYKNDASLVLILLS